MRPSVHPPRRPSVPQVPRSEAIPGGDQQATFLPKPMPPPEECGLSAIPKDSNNSVHDASRLDAHIDGSGESQLTAKLETSESPGASSGQQTPTRQWPRDKRTEDVCDTFLRDAFDVELQDLPANMVGEAWESVNACLEQVSSLLGAKKCAGLSLPIREAARNSSYGSNAGCGFQQYWSTGTDDGLDKGKKRRKAPLRPRRSDGGDQDGSDGDQSSGEDEPGRKKTKIAGPELVFSCPYRKRNPLRFNIRDHRPCAMSWFNNISCVK